MILIKENNIPSRGNSTSLYRASPETAQHNNVNKICHLKVFSVSPSHKQPAIKTTSMDFKEIKALPQIF